MSSSLKSKKNAKTKGGGGGGDDDDGAMGDWITSLAKQVATNGESNQQRLLSKEERVQKRAAKKLKRQQQKQQQHQQQQKLYDDRKQYQNDGKKGKMLPVKRSNGSQQQQQQQQRRLKRLAEWWLSLQKQHQQQSEQQKRQQQRLYAPDKESDRIKRKHALNEENIQPRPCDYSGIGLARKSLFLPFQDPSHIPKLEEEFHEHIPGFFGKQRTKAMKRQLDGNMLWRKMADQREKGGTILPKKIAQLPPDQRVQAMIDAGML